MSDLRDMDKIKNQITRGVLLALVLAWLSYVLYRLVPVLEIVAMA